MRTSKRASFIKEITITQKKGKKKEKRFYQSDKESVNVVRENAVHFIERKRCPVLSLTSSFNQPYELCLHASYLEPLTNDNTRLYWGKKKEQRKLPVSLRVQHFIYSFLNQLTHDT